MSHQFRKHYTREEANALLPRLRQWLKELGHLHERATKLDQRIHAWLEEGRDVGGDTVNEFVRLCGQSKRVLAEFNQREIQIKDLDRGLLDFPALIGGREVFLCWEQDEEDVEFWHDLDTGYASRERL